LRIYVECAELIIQQANRFVELVQRVSDFPKGKDSGYCVVKSSVRGRLILAFQVGECSDEKVEKYLRLANEKADRLRLFVDIGHRSSWQTRDGKDKWGGAVLAGNLIFSFSGLPELADEAVMLWTATSCNCMSPEMAIEIARISDNKIFDAINELMGK
jgi:hypothetical protein